MTWIEKVRVVQNFHEVRDRKHKSGGREVHSREYEN